MIVIVNITIIIVITADNMSMHNSKDVTSQLKLANSSDSYSVGRQYSNEKRRNTTLDYIMKAP